jgi:hypothetical protein
MSATPRLFVNNKMWFFKGNETLGSRLSSFHWATIKYFSGLKMRFLKRPETLGSTLRGHLWAHIRHFRGLKTRFLARRENPLWQVHGFWKSHFSHYVAWKYDSLRVMKPYTHSYLASSLPLFGILAAWKWVYSRVMRTLASNFSSFWWAENAIPAVSWNPSLQGYWLHVGHCGILVTWKCGSSTLMRTSYQRYLAFVALLLDILLAWKYVFSGFLRHSAQGSMSTGGRIFYILLVWKCDSW